MSIVAGLLNQTITSIQKSSDDGYGDKTYTTIYSDVSCRWQEMIENETLPNGKVITYTIKAFLFPDLNIRRGYRVIKDNRSYTIQKYDKKVDLQGNDDHWEVWLN